ncbi:MAG: hypothetical protein ACOX4G_00470 [Limnochordia bacterium]|jgi:hypothetical protein
MRLFRTLVKLMSLSLTVSLICLACVQMAVADAAFTAYLRPTPSVLNTNNEHHLKIPFYQAIPCAEGALQPSAARSLRSAEGVPVPAQVSTAALWPDGSVRWLAIDGVWPSELPLSEAVRVQVSDLPYTPATFLPEAVIHAVSVDDDEIRLLDQSEHTVAVLTPQASYITISEPKQILPDSLPDDERQYAWAEPLTSLNPTGKSIPLNLRIRDCIIEADNDLFTVYRVRGNGGDQNPEAGLEWQLRVRIYHVVPVVRLQMSWSLHWDPQSYALTSAQWSARFVAPFNEVHISGVNSTLDASQGSVQLAAEPPGQSRLTYQEAEVAERDLPEPEWHSLAARTGDRYLGVGTVHATRLGPNHVAVHDRTIELASWSADLGYGLDLRSTALPDEFGLDAVDGRALAIGVTRTMESSLVWASSAEQAQNLAALEAKRDNLWLPNSTDVTESQVFGPWNDGTFFSNDAFFEGLRANLHFLVDSRDHWRWNGWANFGDMRTNFSSSTQTDRGLYAERWSLHGRYGWRHGSAEPYYGLWLSGLALDDRALCLAAIDYALHVADVDVSHASFFDSSLPTDGGMHRRNKDHWSGSVQMQYTPSSGLYLTQWLTGHERLHETLEEVRGYATRQGRSGSAFAAQAWINRYMETNDPEDLRQARALLVESANVWARNNPKPELRDLATLYVENFRRTLDGIPVLIQFHEATQDPAYLDVILEMIRAHGLPDSRDPALAEYHGLAYLLLNGFTEERIGVSLVRQARLHVAQLLYPQRIPPKDQWSYLNLKDFVLTGLQPISSPSYRETAAIGWRAIMAPVVLHALGVEPKEMTLAGPKTLYVGRGGPTETTLSITRLHDQEEMQGYLETRNLPEGLRISPHELFYHIEPGSKQISLPIVLEAASSVAPEAYRISFVDPERSELTLAFPVVVPGWRVVDDFRPPTKDSWFGSFSFDVCEEKSEGWQHDTTDPDGELFDDLDRLCRVEPTAEYLIYGTPGLYDFTLTFYAPVATMEQVASQIAFAVTTDGDTWQPIPTLITWTVQGEYANGTLRPQEPMFRGDGKLRLSVSAGGDAAFPQLGHLEIRGWQ